MSLGPIKTKEIVARVLVHSNQVIARDNAVHYRAFMLSDGTDDISVHRRSHMTAVEAILFAMKTARLRGKAKFYGWAELSAEMAARQGRKVFGSPNENRYHATIQLPPGAANDRMARRAHARMLATYSNWVKPPAELPTRQ